MLSPSPKLVGITISFSLVAPIKLTLSVKYKSLQPLVELPKSLASGVSGIIFEATKPFIKILSADVVPNVTFAAKSVLLVTSSVPIISVLPVDTSTSNFVPTSKVVPSKVKLASSSSIPDVPAITIRLSVKLLTVKSLLIVTSFGNPTVIAAVSAPLPVTSISLAVPAIVAT